MKAGVLVAKIFENHLQKSFLHDLWHKNASAICKLMVNEKNLLVLVLSYL
jgi:hypothetical protein